ncbi:MAG: VIT1/CCC1 transporter family protein [Anaerolineales bacterium]
MVTKKKPVVNRLSLARLSFDRGDVSASALAHTPEAIARAAAEEHGGAGSQYIGDMVLGGLDGIMTSFAVVSGVAGAKLGLNVVMIMGLANLLADGFSMALGSFLSLRSEREYYEKEKSREAWEVEHFPDGEKRELIEIYRKQGYSDEEARRLMEIRSRDPRRWVDAMMVDELRLLPDERTPLRSGLATYSAFVLAGAIPLLVYLAGLVVPIPPATAFFVSLGMSGAALFILGSAKVIVTHGNPLRNGLEMLAVGGLAASVAFIVGVVLKRFIG